MSKKGTLSKILGFAKGGYDNKKKFENNTMGEYNRLRKKAPNSYRSIAQATSDLIATFPVLCTNSISPDSAVMISKAIERKGTTMLQLLLAATNMTDASSGIEYLKQFHNNVKFGGSMPNVDEWIHLLYNAAKDYVGESTLGSVEFVESILSEDGVAVSTEAAQHLLELMKKDNIILRDSIKEQSVKDFQISESKYGYRISINPIVEAANGIEIPPDPRDLKYKPRGMSDDEWKRSGYKMDKETQKIFSDDNYEYKKQKDIRTGITDYEKNERSKAKDIMDIRAKKNAITKGEYDMISKQLLSSDVKKANELVPSLLIVRFTNTATGIETPFIVGVKAKLILCSSFEIIDRISRKNKDNTGLIKFIRATTGELDIFKDFLFGIKDAKIDALSKSNRGSNIEAWRILERLAYKSSKNIIKGTANDAAAITTLVISQQEVEYLMKEYNMDLSNRAVAYSVMDAYNLMSFVIVDESSEIVHFMFDDGEGMFEDIPFGSLERDAGDGMYKKVINLMSRMK